MSILSHLSFFLHLSGCSAAYVLSVYLSPEPKVDGGFLLGYGTNEHAYRVFNKTTGVVETTVDVKFVESNGSQVEQVDMNLIDDEESPNLSIMRMGLGEVRP